MITLTIDELIGQLTALRDEVGGDAAVLVGSQPDYPLANAIVNVCSEADLDVEPSDEPRIWIAVDQVGTYGDVSPYAPGGIWNFEAM